MPTSSPNISRLKKPKLGCIMKKITNGQAAIKFSATEKIGFSAAAQIAGVVKFAKDGAIVSVTVGGEKCRNWTLHETGCFPASARALANCKKSGSGIDILTVRMNGEIVVLALDEAKERGIKETGFKKVGGKWVPDDVDTIAEQPQSAEA